MNKEESQPLNFRFNLGHPAVYNNCRLCRIFGQKSKDFKMSYDIILEDNTVVYDVLETELKEVKS